jgi:predicted AAA+ superfamily ATPase
MRPRSHIDQPKIVLARSTQLGYSFLMTDKESLKEIILDNFKLVSTSKASPRGLQIASDTELIMTIIGPRRAGKTVLLQQVAQAWCTRAPSSAPPLYVNFEDERLLLQPDLGAKIIATYQELYPYADLAKTAFFFDEIQNLPEWETFVRRCHDSLTKNIFVTGSNARLLSTEIASALRGRGIARQMLPLTFHEFLQFKNVAGDDLSGKGRGLTAAMTHEFLLWGGFPAISKLNDTRLKGDLLQEYFNVMVIRDIMERYAIDALPLLKFFLKRLLASDGRSVSINKIFLEMKSNGMAIGKAKIYEWFEYAQDIFLVQTLKKQSARTLERELGEKKLYTIDNGLLYAITGKEDLTKALENIVFRELHARNSRLTFYKDTYECDFIEHEQLGGDPRCAIQVCYSLTEEKTRRREIVGALAACKARSINKALIITREEKEEHWEQDGVSISVLPFARWALSLEKTW